MAYGLRVKDASGNIIIDDVSKINRQRYSKEVTSAETDSTVLSDIAGLLSVELSTTINPDTRFKCAHLVSRSGTTVSWSPADFQPNASLILVFIYV